MSDPRLEGFNSIPDMLNTYGVYTKWPRFTFQLETAGKLVFKLNRNGRNAGGASMELNGAWVGSVKPNGTLFTSYAMGRLPSEDKLDIWNLLKKLRDSPKETFADIGKQSGTCCVCARPLTDPESVANGIGPICSERMFG